MHASPGLLLIFAVLGVVVPTIVGAGTESLSDGGSAVLRLLSLAVVPALAARVAYRQGYERGSGKRPPAAA